MLNVHSPDDFMKCREPSPHAAPQPAASEREIKLEEVTVKVSRCGAPSQIGPCSSCKLNILWPSLGSRWTGSYFCESNKTTLKIFNFYHVSLKSVTRLRKKSATSEVCVGLNQLVSCLNPADSSTTRIKDFLVVFGKSLLNMLAAVFITSTKLPCFCITSQFQL